MKRPLVLVVGILLVAPQLARACNINWTGSKGDGQWQTAGNWDLNRVPIVTDDVCVTNPSFSVNASGQIDIDSLNLLGTLTLTGAGMNLHSTSITSVLTILTVGSGSGLFIYGSANFPGTVTLAAGGTIGGNTSGDVATGSATITGTFMVTGNSTFSVLTIRNQGMINITQPNVQLTLGNSGTVTNQAAGVISIQADGVTINASGTFYNSGTFSKGGTTTGTSTLNMAGESSFINTRLVAANSGTLVLNLSPSTSGNTSTGAFNAGANSILRFATGNITLNAGTRFGGTGTLDLTGAVWTVSAPVTVSTANLILDGTTNELIQGSSSLTLNGKTTWNGGVVALSGSSSTVTVNADKTLLITTANTHGLTCALDILGTVNQNTALLADDLNMGGTMTIEPGAKLNLEADGGVHGSGTIYDLGTFTKTGGTGVSNIDYEGKFNIATTNGTYGTVAVTKGTLNFANSSGGSFNGTSTVDEGATLQFSAGIYLVQDGAKFSGSGTTLISGSSSWNLQGGGTGAIGISVGPGVFQLNGVAGTSLIQGTGNLTVNSKTFNFTGGEMTGTGTITIPDGVTLSISAPAGSSHSASVYILGQTVNNSGIAQITDWSSLYLGGGVTWTNVTATSEFTFKDDGDIADNGGGVTFNNNGIVQKTGGGSIASEINFTGTFNNNGTVKVAAGTLRLNPSVGQSPGKMGQTSTFSADEGATLGFYRKWTISTGTMMIGTGKIVLIGTWNLSADLTVTSATFLMFGQVIDVGGTFNLMLNDPTITLGDTGGTALRQSILQNGKPVGTIKIKNGSQVTVSGGFVIDACIMENFGTLTFNSAIYHGMVTIQDGAVLVNEIGGVITLDKSVNDSTAAIVVNTGNGFTNAGTLDLGTDSGANPTQIIGGTSPFKNLGTLTIPPGHAFKPVNGYTEDGTTILNKGNLIMGATSFVNGAVEGTGIVGGTGSIDDILGKIQAGMQGTAPDRLGSSASATVGILNLSVPLTIESGGTMVAVLNGTAPGTQYDQIISTSSVALGGTLNLQFGDGFSPKASNSFAILSFASSTGSFASVVTPSSTCAATLTTTSTSLSVAFTSSNVAVTIAPTAVTLAESTQQQFTDTVTNGCGNGVTWKVKEGAAGGTITSAGLYTAPAATGTFHVVVTSVGAPGKSATSTVTVTAAAGKDLSVTPRAAVARPGGSVHFAASQSVTWSVAEGTAGGSISATGIYTAAQKPGLYHVIASGSDNAADHAIVNVAVVKGNLKSAYVANIEKNSISVLTASNSSGEPTGPLHETQSVATGHSPVALAVSRQGLLLAANRDSNDVSAFATAYAVLQHVSGQAVDTGTGPSAVAWDPFGRLAFVTNAGSDEISIFSAYQSGGQLSYLGKHALETGDKPSAVAVHPTAPLVFVASAGGNDLHGFTYDLTGRLSAMSGSPFAAGKRPAAIAVDPAGKFLFVANRGSADVSVFVIDAPSETVHEVAGSPFPAGKEPAALVTDATGSYLFVANHRSNTISSFLIESKTGALTPLSQTPFAIQGPTALAADPSGRYLFVANDTTGGVLRLTLDVATGTLTPADVTTEPGSASAIVLVGDWNAQAP